MIQTELLEPPFHFFSQSSTSCHQLNFCPLTKLEYEIGLRAKSKPDTEQASPADQLLQEMQQRSAQPLALSPPAAMLLLLPTSPVEVLQGLTLKLVRPSYCNNPATEARARPWTAAILSHPDPKSLICWRAVALRPSNSLWHL